MARSSGTRGSSFSIIGDGIEVTGDINAKVDLHIDGIVNGDVKCVSLVQGPTSVIKGKVIADTASLSGTVEGSIDAGDLAIASSAKINGDVSYDKIAIEQGANIEGQFKTRGAAKPNIAKTTVDVKREAPPLELGQPQRVA